MAGATTEFPADGKKEQRFSAAICIGLVALTLAVYWRTFHYGFVNLDDDLIVFQNPHVTGGLGWGAIGWAFTHFDSNFYIPLTLVSHMLDWQLSGADAGGHHLVNVLLHALSAVILFLVLRGMTSATRRSAFVAAVFAIHPLHVESVAWISERKDVLGGLFFMLTLWAYARYARQPFSIARYAVVAISFALGLLCKPTLVTLPFVLLLLDWWPLGRFPSKTLPQLILEKIPLLALSCAASVTAVIAEGDAVMTMEKFPLSQRIPNALVSYMTYIRQTINPAGLAAFYPHPGNTLPLWETAAALLMLVAISAAGFALRKERPWILAGWLWYLGMLAPMIGIVQVGNFGHADRCMYLPQTGLVLLATWTAAGICGSRRSRMLLGSGAMVLLVEFAAISNAQATFWKNSEALWTHTLECTSANALAHNDLGECLLQNGRINEAMFHFSEAVKIKPDYAESCSNLGVALFQDGLVDDSIVYFEKALQLQPGVAGVHNNLANALAQKGRMDEAIAHYKRALEINPGYAVARHNLDNILLQKAQERSSP